MTLIPLTSDQIKVINLLKTYVCCMTMYPILFHSYVPYHPIPPSRLLYQERIDLLHAQMNAYISSIPKVILIPDDIMMNIQEVSNQEKIRDILSLSEKAIQTFTRDERDALLVEINAIFGYLHFWNDGHDPKRNAVIRDLRYLIYLQMNVEAELEATKVESVICVVPTVPTDAHDSLNRKKRLGDDDVPVLSKRVKLSNVDVDTPSELMSCPSIYVPFNYRLTSMS